MRIYIIIIIIWSTLINLLKIHSQLKNFETKSSVGTQDWANGLVWFLGSQHICIVGFEFPTIGSPLLGDPIAHFYFCKPLPSFLTKSLPFFWNGHSSLSLSLCSLLRVSNPLTSHPNLLFIAWGQWDCRDYSWL